LQQTEKHGRKGKNNIKIFKKKSQQHKKKLEEKDFF